MSPHSSSCLILFHDQGFWHILVSGFGVYETHCRQQHTVLKIQQEGTCLSNIPKCISSFQLCRIPSSMTATASFCSLTSFLMCTYAGCMSRCAQVRDACLTWQSRAAAPTPTMQVPKQTCARKSDAVSVVSGISLTAGILHEISSQIGSDKLSFTIMEC